VTKRSGGILRVALTSTAALIALAVVSLARAEVNALDAGGASPLMEGSNESSLPPLPDIPRLELPSPTAEEVQELETKLGALFSEEHDTKDSAVGELVEVRAKMVSAIHARLVQMADRSDKERMKRTLNDARRQPGDRRSEQAGPGGGHRGDPDLLLSLLASEKSKEQGVRDCANLLALLRMLSAMGTVEGARELIVAYARFGEFIRVEVQHRLSEMKDLSIAALVEARRHPAEKISRWAALRLDQIGKAIPGESVRTNDVDALADILRAYGRVRDPDAARLIVSFANSERGQLRLAARQAIALLGPVGLWQLRDAYEDVVGRKPRRDWSWERTARELFGEFDRLRLSRVYGNFVKGLQSLEKGDLDAMGKSFDSVLAKDPLFEKRSQMAEGYFKLALELAEKNPDASSLAAIRAERLTLTPKLRDQARSLILALRAREGEQRGELDLDRLQQAVELDSSNKVARDQLASAQKIGLVQAQGATFRWASSAAIAGIGLLAVAFILLRRPRAGTDSNSPSSNAS
jgi:hypothetical protein